MQASELKIGQIITFRALGFIETNYQVLYSTGNEIKLKNKSNYTFETIYAHNIIKKDEKCTMGWIL
jgi:hypothetical protein